MLPVSVLIRNRPKPYLLDADLSVTRAAIFLRDYHIGGAPVIRDGQLVGFASERDIVFRVVAENKNPETTKICDIMSTVVTTATVLATVEECEHKMRDAHVRHLPILDKGVIVACISLRDVLQSELSQAEVEARCLSEYVRGTSADET